MTRTRCLLFLISLILHASCGFKVNSLGSHSNSGNFISGLISPFSGLIAEEKSTLSLVSTASAALCADPVYAKLFAIKTDGSIDEGNPLATQLIGADARYSFDVNSLGISILTSNVQLLVKAEGCNGDTYKRPVTNLNNQQNVDAKSTVIAEVVNATSLLTKTLNQASRADIETLINSVSGTSTSAVLTSLTSEVSNSTKFTEIFGASPAIIHDSSPEVKLIVPTSAINELAVNNFSIQAFHVDPTYSFAYSWKLDGVVKSTSASWNYIPSANESGSHTIVLYVGKNDGAGLIDLTKPYYTKSSVLNVNNNILPSPPNLAINAGTPIPRNINSVSIDLSTGVSLANCATFSHMAITDTPAIPGILQFNIDCLTSGSQTENITFSTGDGAKTIYLWAIDDEGNISLPKTVSLILDSLPPVASLNLGAANLRGGSAKTISLSAIDAGVGLNTLDLYFSTDNGATYSLVSNLSTSATSYDWAVPAIDTTTGVLKLVATDLSTSTTTVTTSSFNIDSTAPSTPTISRTSSAASNSTTVLINATCIADYNKILFSQTSTTPTLSDAAWENCASTKNFTVNTGDGLKTIYVFTRDAIGNISSSSNITMTLDTTAPSAPVANLSSASLSSSSAISFTVTDCLDRPYVLVSESMIAPAAGDANWQTCSTSAAAITHTLIGPILQGSHNLYVYAKDAVGNVSPSTTASIIYDTTNPTLNLSTTLGSLYKGGDIITLTFAASDINGLASLSLEYAADGSTYSQVSALTTNSTAFNWTVPSNNTTNAKIRLVANDNATTFNSTVITSPTFTIDSIAPTAPTVARGSIQYSQSNSVIINTTCNADYYQILYSETSTIPLLSNTDWELCLPTKTFSTSTIDGLKTIYAFTRDTAGNISSSSNISMILDTTLPTLSIMSFNSGGYFQGGSLQNITWTASDVNSSATPISIFYSTDGISYTSLTTVTNSGTYSWALPTIDSLTVTLKIIFTDLAGNTKIVSSGNFAIDSTAPTLSNFSLNSGVVSTTNGNVLSNLIAGDNISKITHFCLKNTISATPPNNPLIGDSCWVAVNSPIPNISPSLNISFNNYYYALGLITSTYNVFAWVKNETGLISTLSNSGNGQPGIDFFQVNYDAGSPPLIINIISANSDSHQTPPIPSEQIITSGQNMYIKWKASDADAALPAEAINIFYTTNDVNYTLIASNLLNGVNGACTVDGIDYTGCYLGTSPTSSYFKIRVVVKDSSLAASMGNAAPNNSNLFRILAGNLEPGIGGSASSAIFNVDPPNTVSAIPGSLVVADNGLIFLKDRIQGILKIDPQTGVVNNFIRITGASTNGAIGTATIRQDSAHMSLDYQNNLLIYDYDRIQKVNLVTNTVTTLIGGGITNISGTLASNFQMRACSSIETCNIIPLPNGDIYFNDGASLFTTTKKLWKYQASDQKVYAIYPTGTGITGKPGTDDVGTTSYGITSFSLEFNVTNSAISYTMLQLYPSVCPGCGSAAFPISIDMNTGNSYPSNLPPNGGNGNYKPAATARNGLIYQIVKEGARKLIRFNSSTNNWTNMLGTGTGGYCVDGTDALSCNINIQDAFIASDSRIYFIDNGLIRAIDSSNKIRTLFGQRRNFGDGGIATSARLNGIYFFDFFSNDDIAILDNEESVIRKFTPGGSISLIAGNGIMSASVTNTLATSTSIGTKWWGGMTRMLVEPGTDDIYIFQNNNRLYRLNYSDQKMVSIIGQGATVASSADNLIGTSIYFTGELAFLLGLHNNQVVISSSERNASQQNHRCNAKSYDATDSYRQTHFTGNGNLCSSSLPTTGSATSTADIFNATSNYLLPGIWDNDLDGWILPRKGSNIQLFYVPGGTTSTFSTLPRAIQSYTVVKNVSLQNVAYYCSTAGSVYKYNLSTSTETLLSLPNATYTCRGFDIKYKTSRGSIIFPVVQNGLNGIAEIINTP